MNRRLEVFYSDTFELPLPEDHRFPIAKYRRLRERLQQSEFADQINLRLADRATDEQLRLVHTEDYLAKLTQGRLTDVEERRIGFPWSEKMVERSRRSTGATVGAAVAVSSSSATAAVHLAGGTHHSFADHGQGFCVFNDVAVAIRVLQNQELARRAIVIDLDVHQGNGTADIFRGDDQVFTCSFHGDRNYPFEKRDGDLDLAFPDGTSDERYLSVLDDVLRNRIPFEVADIVFYLAGADPFSGDRFGKLALSKRGLAERDRIVFETCAVRKLPLVVTMAGGYANDIDDIVDINVGTVETLLEVLPPI